MATATKVLRLEESGSLPAIKEYMTISDLPVDCLCHIVRFLPVQDVIHLPEVCSSWRKLAAHIWRRVEKLDLVGIEKEKNPSSFTYIKQWMREDYYWNMRARFTNTYPILLSLCGKFVKFLTIPVIRTWSIIPIATENCRNLRKLSICFERFWEKSKHCNDLGRLFAKNRGTLRSVIIDNMGAEFSNYADCLLELPEELTELQLWGYKARFARFVEKEVTRYFHRFIPAIKRLKNLQILVLNGLQISTDQLTMIEHFDDLRYLEIVRSNSKYLVPFDIEAISSRRNLEYLSLQRVNNMNVGWFADLVRNNPNLKHLKLQTCLMQRQFIRQLFALSRLETLSVTYLDVWPQLPNLSGFYNLKKFICTSATDQAVIVLLETAPQLKLLNLRKSKDISSRVLNKAHEVTINRRNNVPLWIIVDDKIIKGWKRPSRTSPLLTVENSTEYIERSRYGYEGNDEELYY